MVQILRLTRAGVARHDPRRGLALRPEQVVQVVAAIHPQPAGQRRQLHLGASGVEQRLVTLAASALSQLAQPTVGQHLDGLCRRQLAGEPVPDALGFDDCHRAIAQCRIVRRRQRRAPGAPGFLDDPTDLIRRCTTQHVPASTPAIRRTHASRTSKNLARLGSRPISGGSYRRLRRRRPTVASQLRTVLERRQAASRKVGARTPGRTMPDRDRRAPSETISLGPSLTPMEAPAPVGDDADSQT